MQYEEFVSLREFSEEKSNKTTCAWKLGKFYYFRGEYAAAQYFFSCAAEHSVDDLLSYECLLIISLCFKEQGDKEISRMNALETAISLYPHRPEAFFLKSRWYLEHEMYDDCLKCIQYAYDNLYYMGPVYGNGRNDQTVMISWNILFFGHSHFQFVKALAHYYSGDKDSALECFEGVKEKILVDLPAADGLLYQKLYAELTADK